jgi:hypothetical protein
VIQYRRIAALLLGIWLGAGIFADIAVLQNFRTVDRFLSDPGTVKTATDLHKIGRPLERELLRRNAAEENNYLFENWEWTELFLGVGLLATLFFGERPNKLMMSAALTMWVIVMVQRFGLTPQVTELGRRIADLPAGDPLNRTFWTFHGLYSGAEVLKLGVGMALAARLSVRGRPDPNQFAKEFDAQQSLAAKTAAGIRKRNG